VEDVAGCAAVVFALLSVFDSMFALVIQVAFAEEPCGNVLQKKGFFSDIWIVLEANG